MSIGEWVLSLGEMGTLMADTQNLVNKRLIEKEVNSEIDGKQMGTLMGTTSNTPPEHIDLQLGR
jgi:hypothetical protein